MNIQHQDGIQRAKQYRVMGISTRQDKTKYTRKRSLNSKLISKRGNMSEKGTVVASTTLQRVRTGAESEFKRFQL